MLNKLQKLKTTPPAAEQRSIHLADIAVELDIGELPDPVDGQEHIDVAPRLKLKSKLLLVECDRTRTD